MAADSGPVDYYGGGVTGRLIASRYNTPKFHRAVQRRHERQADWVLTADWNGYKIPIGVMQALTQPLVHVQIANQYPWAVYWTSKKTGKRMRRLHGSLISAIVFHKKAVRVDPHATIISRQRAYDIPPELRGRLPSPWKWCPHCMKPRKYRRTIDGATFYAMVKRWSEEKQRYIWVERSLALMKCPVCFNTNRCAIFRRSNQPWEKHKIKRGAVRVKRQRSMSKKARSRRR